jgi:1,4-alpha-glucan branching enzyme
VPVNAYYKEIFNSDSEIYGGSNMGNFGGILADEYSSHGKPYSIRLQIPPLSTIVLKPEALKEEQITRALCL